jgi:hypothetical protein
MVATAESNAPELDDAQASPFGAVLGIELFELRTPWAMLWTCMSCSRVVRSSSSNTVQ